MMIGIFAAIIGLIIAGPIGAVVGVLIAILATLNK